MGTRWICFFQIHWKWSKRVCGYVSLLYHRPLPSYLTCSCVSVFFFFGFFEEVQSESQWHKIISDKIVDIQSYTYTIVVLDNVRNHDQNRWRHVWHDSFQTGKRHRERKTGWWNLFTVLIKKSICRSVNMKVEKMPHDYYSNDSFNVSNPTLDSFSRYNLCSLAQSSLYINRARGVCKCLSPLCRCCCLSVRRY